MEVYVDDMLVKRIQAANHINDLTEAFQTLRQYGMKFKPSNCAFGVSLGKFLGFILSRRGIEANLEKVRAVLEMQAPRNTKQLQQLTWRIAVLNQFIFQSTKKCFPFFKILRNAFAWNEECEGAFKRLKEYLESPPLLSRPIKVEILFLYLAVFPSNSMYNW